MNRGRQRGVSMGGYTIVETLIFLAVSSLIFVAAVMLIGGQQARAQFQSSVRGFETRLLDVANDVATGYYQNTGVSKVCNATVDGPDFGVSDAELGKNKNCVFVGTVIKLGDGGNKERFVQFTMAGLRELGGGGSVTSLTEAKPKVLDNNAGVFESVPIGAGVEVACVALGSSSCTPGDTENAAFGLFTTFEGASLTGEGGGAVQADVISYGSAASITSSAATARSAIDSFNYGTASLNPGVTICLVGSSNQYALLRLGGNNSSNLTITTEIKEGASCA